MHDVTPLVRDGLDESEKAVQSWKFDPALRDGTSIDFKTATACEVPQGPISVSGPRGELLRPACTNRRLAGTLVAPVLSLSGRMPLLAANTAPATILISYPRCRTT